MGWFRSWHGAPFDPKWRVVAKRANASIPEVIAVVWTLMDHASRADHQTLRNRMKQDETMKHVSSVSLRGDVTRYDAECVSATLDVDISKVEAILKALAEKNFIHDGMIINWEKYQPQWEVSKSTERVRAHRNRMKHVSSVPKQDETGETSPESDIEEERDSEERKERYPATQPFLDKPNAICARGLKKISMNGNGISVAGIYADQRARDEYAVGAIVPLLPGRDDGERWALAMAAEDPKDPNHQSAVLTMLKVAKAAGVGWISPERRGKKLA